jgi:hypothetical protein
MEANRHRGASKPQTASSAYKRMTKKIFISRGFLILFLEVEGELAAAEIGGFELLCLTAKFSSKIRRTAEFCKSTVQQNTLANGSLWRMFEAKAQDCL